MENCQGADEAVERRLARVYGRVALGEESRVKAGMINARTIIGTLLAGVLVAAGVIITFRASSSRTTVKAQPHIRNGRPAMAWRLSPSFPLGIRISASDSNYSMTWTDRQTWESRKPCDTIVLTVGDDESSFSCRYDTTMRHGRSSSTTRTMECAIKSLSFSNVRERGQVIPGTVLGAFRLESVDGHVVTGEISVMEVTEELLYPSLRKMRSSDPS